MSERLHFIQDHQTGLLSVTELCEEYGISRKTAYKWLSRFQAEGEAGLVDRSRAPLTSPQKMSDDVVAAILEARRRHPSWGPKKLIAWLARREPDMVLPAPSTAGELLAREGLVRTRPPRARRAPGTGRVTPRGEQANDVWTADFKGQFKTGDSVYCYPLTVADEASRYLFDCRALLTPSGHDVKRTFERVFREMGLPRTICTDNGEPFASTGICGLSSLNVWWIKLGIQHDRIAPGRPDENGVHERMHKTLKAETARPPRCNLRQQQRAFNCFREEYNEERPHEALGQATPATFYESSPREFPAQVPGPDYAGHLEKRKVGGDGSFHWHQEAVFVSRSLHGEHVGLEEVDDGVWAVYFYNVLLGRFDERVLTMVPSSPEKRRRKPRQERHRPS